MKNITDLERAITELQEQTNTLLNKANELHTQVIDFKQQANGIVLDDDAIDEITKAIHKHYQTEVDTRLGKYEIDDPDSDSYELCFDDYDNTISVTRFTVELSEQVNESIYFDTDTIKAIITSTLKQVATNRASGIVSNEEEKAE